MITIRNTRPQTVTAHVVLNGKDATVTIGPGSTRDVDALLPVSEAYVKSGVLKIVGRSAPAPVVEPAPSQAPPVASQPPVAKKIEPAPAKKNDAGNK